MISGCAGDKMRMSDDVGSSGSVQEASNCIDFVVARRWGWLSLMLGLGI